MVILHKKSQLVLATFGSSILIVSCSTAKEYNQSIEKPLNIIYIMSDDHTRQAISAYSDRYGLTTPNIDKIAEEGVKFTNYYTSDAPCLPSRSAMMSGQFGIHNGAINHGGTNAELKNQGPSRGFVSETARQSLPATLKKAGLWTTYIGGFGERHATYSFYAGFREILDTGKLGQESAEEVTPHALDWIKRNADKDNWYLQINYWDPHTPYRAPEEFGNPFKDAPLPEWITEELIKDQLKNTVGPHGII